MKYIKGLDTMFTKLLFIVIIISCKTFTEGFAKLRRFSMKTNMRTVPFSKTKTTLSLTSACFDDNDDDEDYGNDNRKKKYNFNYGSDTDFDNHIREEQIIIQNNKILENYETVYTLIWFDCDDCKQLLRHVKNERKKILYIDGSYYFFDENDEKNTPLFYKNDDLIATDVFSIYEELFYNKLK
jgi:hypothetical protein